MTEAIWHHTDAAGEQRGPLTAEAIRAGLASGDIPSNARFWRYGLADWVDRAAVASELGLPNPPPPVDPYVAPVAFVARRGPQSGEVVDAGFVRRLAAWFLDWLILGVVLGGVLGIGAALLAPALGRGEEAAMGFVVVFYAIYFGAAALYFAAQESSAAQATLGKRALGIKVTDAAGGRLTFGHALGRWFAAALSYLTFYVGFLMAAFTDRKRALHDFVAGTLVVDKWAYTDHPERQTRETSGCLVALVVGVVLVVPVAGILAAIAIPAYQDYVTKSQFAEAVSIADGLKTQVVETHGRTGSCPVNGQDGFSAPASYAGKYVAQVAVGGTAPTCLLTATFKEAGVPNSLQYQTVVFSGTENDGTFQWTCSAPGIDDKYKPMACR